MTNLSLPNQLKMCNAVDFFEIIENYVECRIPSQIRNILKINSCDSAIALSRVYDTLVSDLENFMKYQFNRDMLTTSGESMEDYLGIFVDNQRDFKLLCGQKRILLVLHEYCRLLYPLDEIKPLKLVIASSTPPQATAPIVPYEYVPSLLDNQGLLTVPPSPLDKIFVNDFNFIDQTALRRKIGSRMITCFNDAKRVTLSGWSWPSRQIAHEMSENFVINGDWRLNKTLDFDFNYLTPHEHAFFIDAIVKSDLDAFRMSLRQSLAVSLRVDGSVDRTGHHNIHVMAHIINRDLTTSTLGMGFGEPQVSFVDGYFKCLKDIVTAILPWNDFFSYVTSVATDGEPLNTGPLNGLFANLKQERRRSANPNLPLFLIWCVPHRINLAWKSTCRNSAISKTIQQCIKLSTYFRKSAVRTRDLRICAEENDLSPPLRYPAFFEIRWTEYVYNLLNAVLRNYRASIKYFELKNETSFLKVWLCYDQLHFITFLVDILSQLKKFQKSCQSDSICISDVLPLRESFLSSLENCTANSLTDGWEQLFLRSVVHRGNGVWFHGIKLFKSGPRGTFKFAPEYRQNIIRSLINHVNFRINQDDSLHSAIRPLVRIETTAQQLDLKTCHGFIASDVDELTFMSEHKQAAELISEIDGTKPKCYLEALEECSTEELHTIKVALARIIVAKPHSADVERLISLYNKFKSVGRSSLSPKALWNYLYIYVNMGSLDQFDPTPAIDYWMKLGNRRPKQSTTSKEREWFNGVFGECESGRRRHWNPKIVF